MPKSPPRQLTAESFEEIYDAIDGCKPYFVPDDGAAAHPDGFTPLTGLRIDGLRLLYPGRQSVVARFGQWIGQTRSGRYVVLDDAEAPTAP